MSSTDFLKDEEFSNSCEDYTTSKLELSDSDGETTFEVISCK